MLKGQMRRLFVGCYLSLFSTTIGTSITTTTTLATLALPLASGFNSRFVSVSALRSHNSAPKTMTGDTGRLSLGSSAADLAEGAEDLFCRSPLIFSQPLSALVGKPVYLKLDALQASGSFKDRGMAHLCATFQKQGTTEVISSSGGNAGLAVATVGGRLGLGVSVIVPETTKPLVVAKLESLGASVTIHGKNWNAADTLAREKVAAKPPGAAEYVSPYDNPLLWTGHSTLIDEVDDQLSLLGLTPGAIVVSVGGGGLLCGVLEGCSRRKLSTKIITSETDGASCFKQSWDSKDGQPVTLDGIDSIATSLGATSCTPVALDRARSHEGGVAAASCTDEEAIDACVRFAKDHRMLVEPACGAALAVAYSKRLREECLGDVEGPIVLEVCGGSGVDNDLLHGWKEEFLSSSK
jgi:L-serine/L-threonine ammonia-lyase